MVLHPNGAQDHRTTAKRALLSLLGIDDYSSDHTRYPSDYSQDGRYRNRATTLIQYGQWGENNAHNYTPDTHG